MDDDESRKKKCRKKWDSSHCLLFLANCPLTVIHSLSTSKNYSINTTLLTNSHSGRTPSWPTILPRSRPIMDLHRRASLFSQDLLKRHGEQHKLITQDYSDHANAIAPVISAHGSHNFSLVVLTSSICDNRLFSL